MARLAISASWKMHNLFISKYLIITSQLLHYIVCMQRYYKKQNQQKNVNFFSKKTAEDYLDAIITENGRNTKKSARKAILTGFLGHLSLVAASP